MDREGETTPETAPGGPAGVQPVVVARWVQLVLLPLSILGLYAIASAAGTVLLLFIVAGVIALILNPLVQFVERARIPRTAAVIVVYLGLTLTVVMIGFLLADPVADQAREFADGIPGFEEDANNALLDIQQWFDDNGIDVQIIEPGEKPLDSVADDIAEASGEIVSFTGDLLRKLVEIGFHLILVLVLSIYMLIYGPEIGRLVRSIMPPGDGTPEDDFPTRVQQAVYNYVRGQLLFSVVMGTSAGVALYIFGALGIFESGGDYAFAFGVFFGLMELVPYVGPVIGAAPPVIVALIEDPLTAVWVALLFLALQQLEGHVVAPNIFGRTLRLNPILVIFALLLGGEIYGLVGALVALPIAAIVRETVIYLRRHVLFEPWRTEAGVPGFLTMRPQPPPGTEPVSLVKEEPAAPASPPAGPEG